MYSKGNYKALLKRALDNEYEFVSFLDERETGKHIYLRYDVNWSCKPALELAEINQMLGVQGTFFFALQSENYNIFSPQNQKVIQTIHILGQHIGFIFIPPRQFSTNDSGFADKIVQDYMLFAREIPEVEPVFIWDNATSELISWSAIHQIPGLLNLYSPRWINDIPMYSDVLAQYSVSDFETILDKGNSKLQLSLHPIFWIVGGETLEEIGINIAYYKAMELAIDINDVFTQK